MKQLMIKKFNFDSLVIKSRKKYQRYTADCFFFLRCRGNRIRFKDCFIYIIALENRNLQRLVSEKSIDEGTTREKAKKKGKKIFEEGIKN